MKCGYGIVLQRVAQTIERYGMFRPRQRAGVAVSGGADSVCLLEVLRELARRWELRLSVLHLDHGLRGEESREDAEFVRALASGMELPFILERAELGSAAGNLEEAAREARLRFFREQIAAGAVDSVALGHTRSDQAETVLFRFLRGAGTAGLAGIRPVTGDGIVRPLLDVTRAETEAFLRARGIAWREDSTNASARFARNRIRHSLLPQLAREWNPALEETLAKTADWALAEEAYWKEETARLAAGCLRDEGAAVLVQRPAAGLDSLVELRKLRLEDRQDLMHVFHDPPPLPRSVGDRSSRPAASPARASGEVAFIVRRPSRPASSCRSQRWRATLSASQVARGLLLRAHGLS